MGGCPSSPPSTPWTFPPADSGDGDLVAIGADLAPGTLLAAYRRGLFPMPVDGRRGEMGWWSPEQRGVLAARRSCGSAGRCASRRAHFEIRVDTAFAEVVAAAPTRPAPAAGSTARSRRRTPSCTGSAGRTPSRPGATACWPAGCTASRSAACSPASRCSPGSATPRRSRCGPRRPAPRRARRVAAARHPVADPAPGLASACARSARRTYLKRLRRGARCSRCPRPSAGLTVSDDQRAVLRVADHRPAGGVPLDHPAGEVDRVEALLLQEGGGLGRSGRRPCRPPAAAGRSGSSASRPGISVSGMCSAPSMWPWCHSTGSRTSRTVTPSGSGFGDPGDLDRGDLRSWPQATSGAWTCAGRPAACRRSGRWRSTAGSSRRSTPRARCRRRPGTSRPVRPCTAMLLFFSPLSSLAASPSERFTASPSTVRMASYRVCSSVSVRLLDGLNGDIFAACRSSSE